MTIDPKLQANGWRFANDLEARFHQQHLAPIYQEISRHYKDGNLEAIREASHKIKAITGETIFLKLQGRVIIKEEPDIIETATHKERVYGNVFAMETIARIMRM